ncbi:hypothetical protein Ccrd_009716 [Cynara cardunculus var. scolymus]|uniref:Uncharacterized protein n=1 Tax=Cynara cardunculus var. scolymus TaxID=59895 RepID=A0A103YMK2_CYNCS|nr:hypothetical protein Ccrd_009716 [Cynara cardunculus var. scolymus]
MDRELCVLLDHSPIATQHCHQQEFCKPHYNSLTP